MESSVLKNMALLMTCDLCVQSIIVSFCLFISWYFSTWYVQKPACHHHLLVPGVI